MSCTSWESGISLNVMFGKLNNLYCQCKNDEIRPEVASSFWQPEPTVKLTVWWVHNHADPLSPDTLTSQLKLSESLTPSDTESVIFYITKQISVLPQERKWWAALSLNGHPCLNSKALFQNLVCGLFKKKKKKAF